MKTGDGHPLPDRLEAELSRELDVIEVRPHVRWGVGVARPQRRGSARPTRATLAQPRMWDEPPRLPSGHAVLLIELLQKQIAEVSAESEVAIRSDEATNGSSAALLARLKGIGPQIATVLWLEGFYRHFNNRREVASYAGLVPTPWRSGSMDRARAGGNRQLRPIVTAS